MDLGDFCLFVAGFWILLKQVHLSHNWKDFWPRTTGLGWLWLIWLGIIIAGLVLNHADSHSAIRSILEFRWMLTFQVLCFTLAWIDWDERLLKWLLAILLYIVVISFILYAQLVGDFRAGGVFQQSMPFSHSFGPVFVLVSACAIESVLQKSKWRWFAVVTALATGLITALSMTRGVWIGMTVAILAISLFRSKKFALIFLSSLLVFFATALIISPDARERTLSTNSANNRSDNERKNIWSANWEIVKDYPILGIGYGENETHLREYFDRLGIEKKQFVSHAHNQYLHFWAGTGTLGLICFLVMICQLLRLTYLAYKKIKPEEILLRALAAGSFGGQICFLVGGLTESNFSIAKNRYMYLLISGIGVSLYYRFAQKENFEHYRKRLSS